MTIDIDHRITSVKAALAGACETALARRGSGTRGRGCSG